MMAQKLQQQLRDAGSALGGLPASKDALIKLLKQSANFLSEVEQSPVPSMLDSMKPCVNALSKHELLKHQDRDVKVLVATCICEILRITAPEAPFSDDILKDIFHLIVGTFSGLDDISSPSFGRRVVILETLARYRSCIVMLDLECDDLINEMFATFFAVISVDHPKDVITSMQKIMILIVEECEDIPDNLLGTILAPLGRKKTDFSLAARRLAMDVIKHCAGNLEPYIKQFLVSSISGDITRLNNSIDYHEVIYDVYQCAPHILHGIVPYITGVLLADALDVRLKAVQLLGELFTLPGLPISESFQPLFLEFLKRLTDRVVEVRISVIEHLKNFLTINSSRPEAPSIIRALSDRLLDYNENVRKQVVAAISDVACHSLNVISSETVRLVAERLRDKSLSVKIYTMERLADLYRFHCLKSSDDSASANELVCIPGKILRCLYDKDFRPEAVELILCGYLFPLEFSISERLKHWSRVFSGFDKVEVKALEQILLQKQRLQQEMHKYLSLRQTNQEDPELQKRLAGCFRAMSRLFSESSKAEEGFQTLHQLKDVNIWKMLTALLDPCTSFHQAWASRGDLLKILGEEHPLYDFMGTLSIKCSYLLFNKEYVKEILAEVSAEKSIGDAKFNSSCMSLLAIIAYFSPSLLSGFEENLVNLLKGDNAKIKEGAAHVLAKAGGTIREKLATTSSSVDLLLERLCLEGSRKQAKYSVQALAAITKDDGLKSLSVLYKRLVDTLEEKTHLPAILQSLGCIAQIAVAVYETREDEIFGFIKQKILECSNKTDGTSNGKIEWDGRSELCLLKIYSIKALVRSYLPVRDALLRPGIEKIIDILKNILCFGDISKNIESSDVDKAHMRLASAKAVLRLSRQWEHKIPLDVFYLTLRVSEDNYPQARKLFISKVQQYIKERLVDAKYACAILLNVNQFHSPEYREGKHNIFEIIQICQQVKVRQQSMQSDGNSTVAYPEYILVYLVHALAHHPSCPIINDNRDLKALEPIYWRLHLFLSALLHGDEGGHSGGSPNKMEAYTKVLSLLNSIKCSEDVVDTTKSKISHAFCDLGLSIAKKLVNNQPDVSGMDASLTLPAALYKPAVNNEGEKTLENCQKSWLGGEDVLAHFEALKVVDKELIVSGATKDEMILEKRDEDGNEVPLGMIMKILKAHGAKKKKKLKTRTSPSDIKGQENDIDVLGVVREINLDSLKSEQSMEVGELIKDGDISESRRMSLDNGNGDVSISRKKKEPNGIDMLNITTPKRKRSTPVHRYLSNSAKRQDDSEIVPNSRSNKTDKKKSLSADKKTPDLLLSQLPTIKSILNKNVDKSKTGGVKTSEKSTTSQESSKNINDSRSPKSSHKKRKVRRISGLTKCSSDSTMDNEELVGSRIKVWWPLDKVFYEGVVQSYDQGKKKHVILYNDGDIEVLNLSKERWELVTSTEMPRKKQKVKHQSQHEEIPLGSRSKESSRPDSGQKRNSAKKAQRKPTPKKHAEVNDRRTPNDDIHADGDDMQEEGDSDLLDARSHSGSEAENVVSSDDGHEGPPTATNDDRVVESVQAQEESSEERRNDKHSDDEPLNAWKARTGKVV